MILGGKGKVLIKIWNINVEYDDNKKKKKREEKNKNETCAFLLSLSKRVKRRWICGMTENSNYCSIIKLRNT